MAGNWIRISEKAKRKKRPGYDPYRGYIGEREVRVANYLFPAGKQSASAPARMVLARPAREHYLLGRNLTRFLKNRDLTFQKLDANGFYRIFTVPVSSSVVPLPKSSFQAIERAAQVLVVSLRKVLQDFYGARSPGESRFVRSLPAGARDAFLRATRESPHYLPALHHEVMREYPFFDNVGLDLVLVDENPGHSTGLAKLPFRLLELNAGSPSGASNNMTILEGLLREDPGSLDSLGRVFPNDHFETLRHTYQSLGESWTGRHDGIQVILPPGGANGAAPEIHQLASCSGLLYCDPGQLFRDEDGWIRMRSSDGVDPVVTAIYSRVNSDSALFDPEKGILLRDPDSGRPLYCVDVLKPWRSSSPELLRDGSGRPVPLESDYAVPGALSAIHSRKLYLGGLNRLLDNKILLEILTTHAPRYFQKDIEALGLGIPRAMLRPPESLPSQAGSPERIERNPEDWVIKAPNLSGGTGVHVLMALDARERRQVIAKAKRQPEKFAYQKVVRIGRIPVAIRDDGTGRFREEGTGRSRVNHSGPFRLANLAADLRMWVFYGGSGSVPKLTHNALVRFAPGEKGPGSAIVNTSKGGGYAPFLVIDDAGFTGSIPARDAANPVVPLPLSAPVPAFAGAQLVQIANLLGLLRTVIRDPREGAQRVAEILEAIRLQVRESASFLHPECVETILKLSSLIERRIDRKSVAAYSLKRHSLQAWLVSILLQADSVLDEDFYDLLDGLVVLGPDADGDGYSEEMRRQDQARLREIAVHLSELANRHSGGRSQIQRLQTILRELVRLRFPARGMGPSLRRRIESGVNRFSDLAAKRLSASPRSTVFSAIFRNHRSATLPVYRETLSSEWEQAHSLLLTDSDRIDPTIRVIRSAWLDVLEEADGVPEQQRARFLEEARGKHFKHHPRIAEIQNLLDRRTRVPAGTDPAGAGTTAVVRDLQNLMAVLPYAAWNLRRFAEEQGVPIAELFCSDLVPERIAILTREQRVRAGLDCDAAGESFARKRSKHGLMSESERFLWIAREQSPLIQLITVGHELVHAGQIRERIEDEHRSLRKGGVEFAAFLNFYANFLSHAAPTREHSSSDASFSRRPLYGLPDRAVSQFFTPVIREVRDGLAQGVREYHRSLDRYGSLFGYMMPVGESVRVKALREVVPALENAKNILFAKECGLRIPLDEAGSALPVANARQRDRYRNLILQAARDWRPHPEALRIIASHQYHGVRFARSADGGWDHAITAGTAPIFLHRGYNQTQQ